MSNRPAKPRLRAVGPNAGGGQMRFGPDEDREFRRAAEALVAEFDRWSAPGAAPADRSDAELLLDWRYQYDDGALDVWTVGHLAEFLLHWCPRKLSAPADLCAGMPGSVAAFVEFLAHTGRLDPASDRPSTIRAWCERNQGAFLAAMANPDNFGMAKSLFAGAGGLDAGRDLDGVDLAALTERVNGLDPDTVGAILDRVHRQAAGVPTAVAPVRLPDQHERLEAVRATPVLAQVRGLAEFCAGPGVALTGTGNLRLADARALVAALDIGDETEGMRSAGDLPGLDRVFRLALAAGAVRRHQGKLVAVARFDKLDDLAAHERIVEAALAPQPGGGGLMQRVHSALAEGRVMLLAGLLHAGPDGVADDEVLDLLERFIVDRMPGSADLVEHLMPTWVGRILDELDDLGLIDVVPDEEPCEECDGEHWLVFLSAAGVGPAADLVRTIGIDVPLRPDPVGASAADLAGLAMVGHPDDWLQDLEQWLDAASDPAEAARDLLMALAAAGQGPLPVMGEIGAVEEAVPAHAVEAVRALLGGPADGTALTWLLDRGAIDPAEVSPERMQGALLDILALSLDVGGEQELVAAFGLESAPERAELLDEIWRVDHPRLGEILDVLGARLPDKAIAKRARRAAVKLRTRLGQQAARWT
ncbi:hypothetical protein [Sporichthya sp.]|uniref:hypothetical protein n=1 Tax=Sporichthya sp. TaxID=65475 RepID=UPI0017BD9475|nr:hypothetical protein [Sporichthya sp.]MBA3744951.1 hypothetical protein [Sporichthya sp.]